MAVPVIASSTSDTTGGTTNTTVSLTEPTGLAANDLILVLFTDENANLQTSPAITSPDAYTRIACADNASDVHATIYWRIATASETWPLVIAAETGDYAAAWCLRISGVNTTSPINQTGSWAYIPEVPSDSTLTATEVTTDVADCLGISLLALDGSDLLASLTVSGTGWSTSPATLEDPAADTGGIAAAYTTKNITSAGASVDVVWDWTGLDGAVTIQIAIAPPSGGTNTTISVPTGPLR